MKYAIDYRNMNTGVHGLIFFDRESCANKWLSILNYDEDTFQCCLDVSVAIVEEVQFRTLEKIMKNLEYNVNVDGKIERKVDNVKIINYEKSVDVYM